MTKSRGLRNRSKKPLIDRFHALIRIDPSGCWTWTGTLNGVGYGRFNVDGRLVYPHRWSYEHFVGPIAEDLEIDHLCRNRSCCNPAHLEAVTHAENLQRGGATRRLVCSAGHRIEGANLLLRPTGRRDCRECNRLACSQRGRRLRRTLFAVVAVLSLWLGMHASAWDPYARAYDRQQVQP